MERDKNPETGTTHSGDSSLSGAEQLYYSEQIRREILQLMAIHGGQAEHVRQSIADIMESETTRKDSAKANLEEIESLYPENSTDLRVVVEKAAYKSAIKNSDRTLSDFAAAPISRNDVVTAKLLHFFHDGQAIRIMLSGEEKAYSTTSHEFALPILDVITWSEQGMTSIDLYASGSIAVDLYDDEYRPVELGDKERETIKHTIDILRELRNEPAISVEEYIQHNHEIQDGYDRI